MTSEEYKELKEVFIDNIKDLIRRFGALQPMITVFAEPKFDDKPAIIHIPVPPQFMKNDYAKEEFVMEVIPEIFSSIKENFVPVGVAWSCEANVREASKEEYEKIENYKELPVTREVVFISIETDKEKESFVYNILRNGKQVTKDGDLIDIIDLEVDEKSTGIPTKTGGTFSNLFRKFED